MIGQWDLGEICLKKSIGSMCFFTVVQKQQKLGPFMLLFVDGTYSELLIE